MLFCQFSDAISEGLDPDNKLFHAFVAHIAIGLKEVNLLAHNMSLLNYFDRTGNHKDMRDEQLNGRFSEATDIDRVILSVADPFSRSLEDKEAFFAYLNSMTFNDLKLKMFANFVVEQRRYELLTEISSE